MAAFQEGLRQGYRRMYWLDSSIVAAQPLTPLWDELDRVGYYFLANGFSLGNWCSDDALSLLGMTRDEAFPVPLITGSVIGFNFDSTEARDLFAEWVRLTAAGAMNGPHVNACVADHVIATIGPHPVGFASADPRVYGHRHDESVLAAVIHRAGARLSSTPWCRSFADYDERTVLKGRSIRPNPVGDPPVRAMAARGK